MSRTGLFRLFRKLLPLGLAAFACLSMAAQSHTPLKGPGWDGHLVWVLPFQNNSSQHSVDWIGSSFPDILNQRLTSAGFLTIRRDDSRHALTHLDLPPDFHPTQATAYRIARTLDADYVVFGNYTVANDHIVASARVLTMNGPQMGAVLSEEGDLNRLIAIEDDLAWKVAMQINHDLNLDEPTFVAASGDLRLSALENYIRGQMSSDPEDSISHLLKAVQLRPNYTQAWYALGRAYFANEQYEKAGLPFSKVPKGDRFWLGAMFYAGLSHLYTGDYTDAQNEFAAIAAVLPLPEVLNNEGIAINRKGGDGTPLFQRVTQLDPQNPDYWFNLAVSEWRTKNDAGALKAVNRSLELRPKDDEAARLKQHLLARQVPPSKPVGSPSASVPPRPAAMDPDFEPLEHIVRSYNESSFRQAAFEIEQLNAVKLQSMPAALRAKQLSEQGDGYVKNGLLLEAERQFQLALAADPSSAAARAGLAEVHEHAGSMKLAQQEAEKSLQEAPNVAAYLVLARIALSENLYPAAKENAQKALQIEPNNTAAKGILQAVPSQSAKP